ncbi:hypothetical protein SNOG_03566 [Parastagonospora nodorum SN15]|uniref:Uncharacterized protein n=1 Tax=Phaeosphaeria nodorum (strain SN15 / ATCC MYA-4574 / FGSC 10173) TaxID=321614 RepID=Q0UXE8_PHANO|nr:hypothetical protein SNOG_03566 [Parastagonospora nodorum SN15]EAT88771.1 hypothetical protein SNOG_03566 [Parastagonospora nodorum SN15]
MLSNYGEEIKSAFKCLQKEAGEALVEQDPLLREERRQTLLNSLRFDRGKDSYLLSFFFNARGEDIEKLMIGTYKSLQKQLFKQIPALDIDFD